MQIPVPVATVGLLVLSNVFMTFAWYGHLKHKSMALPMVIFISWCIAFFEYVLQVPANRIGYGYFNAAELKTIQAASAGARARASAAPPAKNFPARLDGMPLIG